MARGCCPTEVGTPTFDGKRGGVPASAGFWSVIAGTKCRRHWPQLAMTASFLTGGDQRRRESTEMVAGVDHVAIAAKDTRALGAWYCEVLGLRILFDNGKEPPTYLVGGDMGAVIEIMPDN